MNDDKTTEATPAGRTPSLIKIGAFVAALLTSEPVWAQVIIECYPVGAYSDGFLGCNRFPEPIQTPSPPSALGECHSENGCYSPGLIRPSAPPPPSFSLDDAQKICARHRYKGFRLAEEPETWENGWEDICKSVGTEISKRQAAQDEADKARIRALLGDAK